MIADAMQGLKDEIESAGEAVVRLYHAFEQHQGTEHAFGIQQALLEAERSFVALKLQLRRIEATSY